MTAMRARRKPDTQRRTMSPASDHACGSRGVFSAHHVDVKSSSAPQALAASHPCLLRAHPSHDGARCVTTRGAVLAYGSSQVTQRQRRRRLIQTESSRSKPALP